MCECASFQLPPSVVTWPPCAHIATILQDTGSRGPSSAPFLVLLSIGLSLVLHDVIKPLCNLAFPAVFHPSVEDPIYYPLVSRG